MFHVVIVTRGHGIFVIFQNCDLVLNRLFTFYLLFQNQLINQLRNNLIILKFGFIYSFMSSKFFKQVTTKCNALLK